MTKETVVYLSFKDTDGNKRTIKSTKPLHEVPQVDLIHMINDSLGIKVEGVILVEVMNEDSSGDIIEGGE